MSNKRSDLTYRMMRMLVANDGNRPGRMLFSGTIAEEFDVAHKDVLYLLSHQAEMGRLSVQIVKDPDNSRKVLGKRFSINSDGFRWVSEQTKKRNAQ